MFEISQEAQYNSTNLSLSETGVRYTQIPPLPLSVEPILYADTSQSYTAMYVLLLTPLVI